MCDTDLADGHIGIHDDRWLTFPWGVNGGKPGQDLLRFCIDMKIHKLFQQNVKALGVGDPLLQHLGRRWVG